MDSRCILGVGGQRSYPDLSLPLSLSIVPANESFSLTMVLGNNKQLCVEKNSSTFTIIILDLNIYMVFDSNGHRQQLIMVYRCRRLGTRDTINVRTGKQFACHDK